MKITLLFSGGLDSTTVLYLLRAQGHEVSCLAIDYGQTHRRELLAAKDIAENLSLSLDVSTLQGLWNKAALVGGSAVPEGDVNSNIIPNRNMIFLAMAMAHAIENGSEAVAWGPNRDDFGTYPDCRESFAESMRSSMAISHTFPIQLLTPLIQMTKAEVVLEAKRLDVPTGATWSCYTGGRKPCRTCGACVARSAAFSLAATSKP